MRTETQQHGRALVAWQFDTGTSSVNDGLRARFVEPMLFDEVVAGTACAGPLGQLPQISRGGDAFAGSEDFGMDVSNAPPTSLAVLAVGDAVQNVPIPGAPGCTLHVGLPPLALFPAITDSAGLAGIDLPLPCSIPDGFVLRFQWAIFAPTVNVFGWITSDASTVTWHR